VPLNFSPTAKRHLHHCPRPTKIQNVSSEGHDFKAAEKHAIRIRARLRACRNSLNINAPLGAAGHRFDFSRSLVSRAINPENKSRFCA
jgi:hypothetical protein